MMDFMYGITGRSCVKSNSDSLNKSVDKSFYDSRGIFAVIETITSSNMISTIACKAFVSSSYIRAALVVLPYNSHFSVDIPFFYPVCELQGTTLYRLLAIALTTRVPR